MAAVQPDASQERQQQEKDGVHVASSSLPPTLSPKECKAFEEFDYVRFTFADLHGIGRCRSIARRHLQEYITRGVDVFAGITSAGPRCDYRLIQKEVKEAKLGNAVLHPMPDTLRPLPWAADGTCKVGEVLCESFWSQSYRGGGHQDACPRYVARKQLDALEKLGLSIYSSFEVEFKVYNTDTRDWLFESDMFSSYDLSTYESYLYDLESNLFKAGVDVGTTQIEYAGGQFELALKPRYGIESGDVMFRAKQYIKEITKLRNKNMEAVFMSMPEEGPIGNGLHFNHSVWKTGTKENAFHDPADPEGLSQVARYWLAGLVKHATALTALCSPTVNCYRRLHNPWAPRTASWAIDDRLCSFRVKNNGPLETYVESRLPSGAANPYIVLAATVAAGMSGIRNAYAPADPNVEDLLPKSFGAALDALEKNEVLTEALGEEFVRWFVSMKREMEIDVLKNGGIEEEKKMYWKMF